MLAGPHHTSLPEEYFILCLRKLDLGSKQRGMLSADSKELGRSVTAGVWLHSCHLLVLGERQNVAALILCYCGSRAWVVMLVCVAILGGPVKDVLRDINNS